MRLQIKKGDTSLFSGSWAADHPIPRAGEKVTIDGVVTVVDTVHHTLDSGETDVILSVVDLVEKLDPLPGWGGTGSSG